MNKPMNYDETQAGGEHVPVDLGGHRMVIKLVEVTKSKTGKDMIIVYFDFSGNDAQAGYFGIQHMNDDRPNKKKWPNQGTQYILVNNSEGKCNRDFKTFITCTEHSNAGFNVKWGSEINNWAAQFKGKGIGGVFGEQMDYYDGKERKKRVLRWFVSLDKVADAAVPDMSETKAYKEYKQYGGTQGCGAVDSDGFMDIPDGIDDQLPFN